MCLQVYRIACHISDSDDSMHDKLLTASNSVMDKLVLFMLTEVGQSASRLHGHIALFMPTLSQLEVI